MRGRWLRGEEKSGGRGVFKGKAGKEQSDRLTEPRKFFIFHIPSGFPLRAILDTRHTTVLHVVLVWLHEYE